MTVELALALFLGVLLGFTVILVITMTSQASLPHLSDPQRKAKQLLFTYLTDIQAYSLQRYAFFECVGSKSNQIYRIYNDGTSLNVKVNGRRYCSLPPYSIGMPYEDAMLIKKLLIENDEDRFLRTSCPH